MTDQHQQKINEAFETYLKSNFSTEIKQQIVEKYGKDVADDVKKIYDEALDSAVDWRTATMDDALDVMHQFLTENYPWLSDQTQTKINYAFIMTWK